MRDYELTLVVRPDVEDTALTALLDKVKDMLSTAGAQNTQLESWGRRTLAYPIKKVNEGQYFLFRTQLPPQALRDLERNIHLTEQVLRFLFVRADE
jgi:small subunit ribosomal protein S6